MTSLPKSDQFEPSDGHENRKVLSIKVRSINRRHGAREAERNDQGRRASLSVRSL